MNKYIDDKKAVHCNELEDKIIIKMQYDLNLSNQVVNNSYIAISEKVLYQIENNLMLKTFNLSDIQEIVCWTHLGCGCIVIKKDDKFIHICRFRMQWLSQAKQFVKVVSDIKEELPIELESDNQKVDRHNTRIIQRIINLYKDYYKMIFLLIILMIVLSSIVIVRQFALRNFIDNVLLSTTPSQMAVVLFGLLLFILAIIHLIISAFTNQISVHLGSKVSRDLRSKMFRKINNLPMRVIDGRQIGELMNRTVSDVQNIRNFIEHTFNGVIVQIFIVLGSFTAMLFIDPLLTLLTILVIPPSAILISIFNKGSINHCRKLSRATDRADASLQDTLSGIRVVKLFGREKLESQNYQKNAREVAKLQEKNEKFWAIICSIIGYLGVVGTLIATYWGGRAVIFGSMTPGVLVQFLAYTGMVLGALSTVSNLPKSIISLRISIDRIYEILDEQCDHVFDASLNIEIKGDIRFENISFGYSEYNKVLQNVSFHIKKGEMIGLVGSSGTGKSTIINLLMRLYNVQEGELYIDDTLINNFSKQCLSHQMGIVLQESFLFTGTVLENIRFSRPEATLEEVICAAETAQCHSFICSLPNGYDTYLGEKGAILSGGEKQRITIARALLVSPRILILDEATSHLDTETELQIQETIDRMMNNRTTVTIAHRLSTLRNANRLFVVENHGIVESGTHQELMKKKGIYYGMVMAQYQLHDLNQIKL